MLCPYCGYDNTKVLESRFSCEKNNIRRRRECENCKQRFTTYEKIELTPLNVIKKNGSKEVYSREKLIKSINIACNKCGIKPQIIQEIADRLELEFSFSSKKEVHSRFIGQKVLSILENINKIAYIRYLSVFEEFSREEQFFEKLQNLTYLH
ncbi:MAG: transcriptional regulator NrdR [Candidatus Gastranaerophilales bacterium]|nr:transcriptional regulator NrdR [Candidatus Gastranaerophilales bacterium]